MSQGACPPRGRRNRVTSVGAPTIPGGD